MVELFQCRVDHKSTIFQQEDVKVEKRPWSCSTYVLNRVRGVPYKICRAIICNPFIILKKRRGMFTSIYKTYVGGGPVSKEGVSR